MSARSECLAAGCTELALGDGTYPFACLAHALALVEAAPRPPAAPARPDLRGRCWADRITCPSPAVTATLRGSWCAEHAPPARTPAPPRAGGRDELPPELLGAALVAIRELGAVPLRTHRTYGEWIEGAA